MQPQPLEKRVERLEERVTVLEQLPARVDRVALEISQLRVEMRAEFSAVRYEGHARLDLSPNPLSAVLYFGACELPELSFYM